MTRARILKSAQPAPKPAAAPARPAEDLPWLADSPQSTKPVRRQPLERTAVTLESLRRKAATGLAKGLAAALAASRSAFTAASAHRPAAPSPAIAPQTYRKRAALLLAIITVPAMAAPSDFTLFASPEPAAPAPDPLALAAASALPFERPGMSFPGSAFFFLDEPPAEALIALPTSDPLDKGAEGGRELGDFIHTGPAAKPFFSSGVGLSHGRALDCLAQAVWYEAANESEAGQRAVAQVVLNRVAHPNWPASVCGVVFQGSERSTGCQFTFTCDGSLSRRAGGASWARAQTIASEALSGKVYAPVGHATHYHTLWVNPYWAASLDHVGTIGAHRFYRNRGRGGEKAAFTMAYAGFEPSVSGRMSAGGTAAAPVAEAALPVTYAPLPAAGASAADRPGAGAGKASGKAPAKAAEPADPAYAGSGDVRPEFANVGQWKSDPAALPLGK